VALAQAEGAATELDTAAPLKSPGNGASFLRVLLSDFGEPILLLMDS
jgi:hypothetical protein